MLPVAMIIILWVLFNMLFFLRSLSLSLSLGGFVSAFSIFLSFEEYFNGSNIRRFDECGEQKSGS